MIGDVSNELLLPKNLFHTTRMNRQNTIRTTILVKTARRLCRFSIRYRYRYETVNANSDARDSLNSNPPIAANNGHFPKQGSSCLKSIMINKPTHNP